MPSPWREDMFVHNLAILSLGTTKDGTDRFAMVGGTQGFELNTSCNQAHRELLGPGSEGTAASLMTDSTTASCLRIVTNELENTPRVDVSASAQSTSAAAALSTSAGAIGIRLSIGQGLPWTTQRWSLPHRVISGDLPDGCVDRRPQYTGFPHLHACQFDGRLSLARAPAGGFLLYARANLKFGAISGGRFVQVTHSNELKQGWASWQPISISGVDAESMDIYFFAAQANPVDPSSLLALFPLTEPPFACIAFTVSVDGVHFSRPVNLRQVHLGVRSSNRLSEALEWRSEDHPVAGALRVPSDPSTVLLYIHHAVKGTTVRRSAVAHVRVYTISADVLAKETRRARHELERE